jgi:cytochrome P450
MYIAFIRDCEVQITAIKKGLEQSKHAEAETSHATIFHELLENKDMPASEKSIDRLVQEGQVIVSAGTETTAWCLSVTTFHLLSNPQVLQKLRAELEGAMPKPSETPTLASLEQLPYLTACIQEGLRLSYGVSSRLQRISPDRPMVFNDGKRDWEIPAGVSRY